LEQQTPAVQQQQQQRPIQAQAARNGLQGQPPQPQLPPGVPFPNHPGFIANAFPGFPTIMWQPPAIHGQLPMAPIPLANVPNMGEQANGMNQNIQQHLQQPQQNNSQDTRQNSQSINTEDRTTTEVSNL
jgi:hypothetical protein